VARTVDPVPNVRLRVSSRPENVLLVRQTLRGLAEAVQLDEVELNDITTAVTEACNNVVSHAYGDRVGELEVEGSLSAGGLEVLVRDRGEGIGAAAQASAEEDLGGIGLPVIRALTEQVTFSGRDGGGTEVRMHFANANAGALARPLNGEPLEASLSLQGGAEDAVAITVGPARLARAVLPRVLSALAARARFSTLRISETQHLAEELVAHVAGSYEQGRLSAGISVAPRNLELTVGPLREGSSRDGLATMLERFADEHSVQRADSVEVLAVRLVEPPVQ
jgi:serine/threonine-protein kinase RsbW